MLFSNQRIRYLKLSLNYFVDPLIFLFFFVHFIIANCASVLYQTLSSLLFQSKLESSFFSFAHSAYHHYNNFRQILVADTGRRIIMWISILFIHMQRTLYLFLQTRQMIKMFATVKFNSWPFRIDFWILLFILRV